jgi:carboxylate-amine ligase
VDELGSREEIEYIHQILRTGTGADRQIAVFEATQDVRSVVDFIVQETHHGLE